MLKTKRLSNIWPILLIASYSIMTGYAIFAIINSEDESTIGLTIGAIATLLVFYLGVLILPLESYAKNRFDQKLRHYLIKGYDPIDTKYALNQIQKEQKALQAQIDELELFIQYEEFDITDKMVKKQNILKKQLTQLSLVKQFILDHKQKERT